MPKRRVVRHEVTQPSDTSYRLIPLTRGQNAIVDAGDYDWLNQWNWLAMPSSHRKSFYAVRRGGIRMHRVILGCTSKEEGDHRNHDTLDNRRSNLRKCSHAQNTRNAVKRCDSRSSFKGATLHAGGRWQAYARLNGKRKHIGTYDTAEEAARAYDTFVRKNYGDFSTLNFPNNPPPRNLD